MALRFRRNVLRPGESHRVTRAVREYRKPGVGRGAVPARHRRVPESLVHPPGPLPARRCPRPVSPRCGRDPSRTGGALRRRARSGCRVPLLSGWRRRSPVPRGRSRDRGTRSRRRPPAGVAGAPSSAEPGRTTSPLTFLPRRARFRQSGLDGVLAGTEPVEGVVDLGSGVAVAALAAIHIRETAPAPGFRPPKFRRPRPKRTDLARTRHLHLRDGAVRSPVALPPPPRDFAGSSASESLSVAAFGAPGVCCVPRGSRVARWSPAQVGIVSGIAEVDVERAFLPARAVRAPVANDPPNRPGAPGSGVAVAVLVAVHFEDAPTFGLPSGLLRRNPRSGWTAPVLAVCIFGRRRLLFPLL